MSGTMSGPGAMASPARSADQPQTPCSHSTIESSIAAERGREEDGDERGPGEAARAEQRRVDQRSTAAQAVQHEEGDECRRATRVPTMAG